MRVIESGREYANLARPIYFIGLDLGQRKDPSAFCVLERTGTGKSNYRFECKYLKRWKLKTDYPTVINETLDIVNHPQLRSDGRERPTLAVDGTGCGLPVVDLLRRSKLHARFVPIQIVAGSTVSRDGDLYRVPKRDLVSVVQIYLQSKRLKIAPELPESSTLTTELQNFKVKITDAANDIYGTWREGDHDDLVLSVAMAMWAATEAQPGKFWSFEGY